MELTVPKSEKKPLFILVAKKHEWKAHRDLTVEERLAGWKDSHLLDGQNTPVISNEWHEEGRMHSLSGTHVLAWQAKPGDEIIGVLEVSFDGDMVFSDESGPEHGLRLKNRTLTRASVDSHAYGRSGFDHQIYVFKCESVLGRAVMLGEDGAEDAFGNDALRQTLEAALDNDWRPQLCECTVSVLDRKDGRPAEIVVEVK